jgi:hypothetical protein
MTRYFIHRGRPGESWSSFTGGSYGTPNRGYYLQRPAAERAAQEIANLRNGPVHIVVDRGHTIERLGTFEPVRS